ncbi:MAG TPA: biotin/lipoyl-containing protein [Ktedonobacteraceae bacterium]|nr:biotin/lipoyl-containing protein [Ktedonobacteraceae bacterium]
MDGNKGTQKGHPYISQNDRESHLKMENDSAGVLSIEQLRYLVRLLDRSDVSELEIKNSGEGTRLVLRKAKALESNGQHPSDVLNAQFIDFPAQAQSLAPATAAPEETRHHLSAHLVGIFHRWAKPRGGALVAVGDRVKVGQLVATIESLNVINDVESPIAGRVIEILVQEGQPVEYGQYLMLVDSAGEEEGA